ncbi:DUF6973 domain-containing protein [Cochleicola gelatinilyticus]|uniref:DUF6973 domain-containing protein n=1 Tax=Cochleicola gelatinilyticus TaxID=1763537 RepID=A0A167IZ47_9FLAO|nr:hypothetical protein [Cochleicola gelatinilyticus]OAB80162.1 hypothetical protein ULVI_05345 [Cochleicola gelatinilyticus]
MSQLSVRQFFKLSALFISEPLLIFPTIRATTKSIKICNNRFGNAHHKSNKANAFRHALWNVLICMHAFKKTSNKKRALLWTQKVTTLYEKVTQNEAMDEAMDLHNNEVGRRLFSQDPTLTEAAYIQLLTDKMNTATQLKHGALYKLDKNLLVYISES